ncbi:MAG: hypothetical protein OEZ59_05760 [Deltaproteobacteria bacterium]|nr:hypothetical protein [Deltaproteobacteria bacterium]
MRSISSILAVAMVFTSSIGYAQMDKMDAAVTPLAAMGELNDAEKGIIFNSMLSNLSKSYILVSQEDYAKAEEKAFTELDAEKCTAEQCIKKIQDILQVDRLFVLQIIREKSFTQISLTLTRSADKIVRSGNCKDCSVDELHIQVNKLVGEVARADMGNDAYLKNMAQTDAAGAGESGSGGGGVSWVWWLVGALALGAVVAAASGGGDDQKDSSSGSPTGGVSATW